MTGSAPDPAAAGQLSVEEYDRLVEAGILGPIELLYGRVLINGRYEMVFSPEQAAAAARLGVRVRTCADAAAQPMPHQD